MATPTSFNGLALALTLSALGIVGSSPAQAQVQNAPSTQATAPGAQRHRVSPFRVQTQSTKAQNYWITAWGVDQMRVSYTASGNLIRFSYRVSDPARATLLGDKRNTPYLYGQRSRAMLQVPVMDKVGILRQATAQQAGQEYWMVFSNKGNLVRPGDRVNVIIGAFHADGLMVE